MQDAIRTAGIQCETIGRVETRAFGLKIRKNEDCIDLPNFDRDEIARIFASEFDLST